MQSESLHQITKGDSASHFHKIRLGDALSFVVDNRGKTPPLDDKGTHDLLEINAIVGQKKFPNFELVSKRVNSGVYESWFRKGHPKVGDVLFSTVGSIAEVAYVAEERGCIAQNLVALRPKADVLDGEFLYYTLSSFVVKQRIISLDISSVQPSIKLPHLMDFEIELPPISSQVKIASFLGKLDDKIALNRQINQTLEAMAQAIFKSWFVDFDPVKAKIAAIEAGQDPLRAAMSAISGKTDAELDVMPRPQYDELAATAALFPEELEESELGDVPKGWEVKSIADVAKFANGKIESALIDLDSYISTENMLENRGGIAQASSLPSTPTVPRFSKGQILISNIRPYFKKIWLARFDGGRSADVLAFEALDQDSIEFVYNLLYQDDFFEFMMRTSKGAKMPRGDKDAILGWKFVCADTTLTRLFSLKIRHYYSYIESLNAQVESLSELRDTLLPKLLSGELSVAELEEAV